MRRALAVFLLLCLGTAARAEQAGGVSVEQVWARATAPGAKNGAVYLTIVNSGSDADKLVAVSTGAADMAMVHETKASGGMMTMEAMDQGLDIPAGQTVTLKPGGMHIMLTGLKHPLALGATLPLALTFDKAGTLTVTATITGPGATAPPAR